MFYVMVLENYFILAAFFKLRAASKNVKIAVKSRSGTEFEPATSGSGDLSSTPGPRRLL